MLVIGSESGIRKMESTVTPAVSTPRIPTLCSGHSKRQVAILAAGSGVCPFLQQLCSTVRPTATEAVAASLTPIRLDGVDMIVSLRSSRTTLLLTGLLATTAPFDGRLAARKDQHRSRGW